MSFLEIKQLTKHYNARTVVSAVDLEMNQGEILSLLGPSGCGKTTILRMIAGLITPDGGYIRVNERVFYDNGRQLPTEERQLGMVFQDLALWPHMTIAQNIGFGLRLRRLSTTAISDRVNDLLALVNLPGFGARYPHQLSGGQQQRIAVARALATAPNILLLDEPLSSLDTNLRADMREELMQLFKRLNMTAINVTHDQDEATMMSDRIMVLRDGHIQQIGIPTDVYLEPETAFVAGFIGQANLLRGQKAETSVDRTIGVRLNGTDHVFCSAFTDTVRARLDHQVMLLCRPDNVVVHKERPESTLPNVLYGTVAYTSFVAGRWRTLINVLGQERAILAFPNFGPRIDQPVWLELPSADCRVLPIE